jgi:hypothetical protein
VVQLIVGLLWNGIVLAILAHSYGFQWPAFDRWQDFTYVVALTPFLLLHHRVPNCSLERLLHYFLRSLVSISLNSSLVISSE